MKTRIPIVVGVLAAAISFSAQAADFSTGRTVTDAQLDRIRGGFDFGDNMRASFALQRTVLINGMEAMSTTISVPDIARITADQAAALQDALRTTVITNGAGGVANAAVAPVTNASAATSGAVAIPAVSPVVTAVLPNTTQPGLIVQNSLDNQAITANTTIDASVNTATMLQNMRVAEGIQDAVIQYRGN